MAGRREARRAPHSLAAWTLAAVVVLAALGFGLALPGGAIAARTATVSVGAPARVAKGHRFNVVVSGRPRRKTLLLVFYQFTRKRPFSCTSTAGGEILRGAGELAQGVVKHRFRAVARRLYSSKRGVVTYCAYVTRSLTARPDATARATTTIR